MKLLVAFACLFLICSGAELDLPCAPSCQHGQCVAQHGQLTCKCDTNWFGRDCSQFICEEDSSICENGGTCFMHPNNSTAYLCSCPTGYYGKHCEYQLNAGSCSDRNCSNNGTCFGRNQNGTEVYECICNDENYGSDCQYSGVDPCKDNTAMQCFGHGTCTHNFNGIHFSCDCDYGYVSEYSCEDIALPHDVCRIYPNICQNGGNCTTTEPDEYSCNCSLGYKGKNCTEPFDVCAGSCLNGGTCREIAGGHYYQCLCPPGYTGWSCDTPLPLTTETEPPTTGCLNNGILSSADSSLCDCPLGYSGRRCETWDPCAAHPCPRHSMCVATSPQEALGRVCVCAEGWGGALCEVDLQHCTNITYVCPVPDCADMAGNGSCEGQCNNRECGFDGGDCLPPRVSDPWQNCLSPQYCRLRFLNSYCDMECNTPECLFDGGECAPPPAQCPVQCTGVGEDGVCTEACNTPQCPFDGQDCTAKVEEFASGTLVLVLVSERNEPFTGQRKEEFLLQLSRLINSIPVLVSVMQLNTDQELADYDISPDEVQGQLVYVVVMRLDVTQCRQYCPQDTEEAADWIQAAINNQQGTFGAFSVKQVHDNEDEPETSSNTVLYSMIGVGVVLVVLIVLASGMIIGKRKRVTAKLWRPTSPSSEGAAGQSGNSVLATDSSLALESKDYMEKGSKKARMSSSEHVQWENVTAPVDSSVNAERVVVGQKGRDVRKWGILHTRDVGKLVEQYRHQNGRSLNIDTPGPGGFTPLMLVVMRRPGISSSLNYQSRSSSESSSDDQTALLPTGAAVSHMTPRHLMVAPVDSTVQALIEAKANLDAVNDYGQTALHLAASCSRPEYVDLLMEAGANPNIQDNWGQSPLHAAIGAGAEGSFMVLLNSPRTKINLKSDGGITALMSAVKMMNGFMVKQLLKRDSEIIASVDDDGRTAVHWAAMVDNIDALRVLVKCGAETIKDAQDSKGQTPLFLACREGSIMCVKHLIDCFANVTLLDNLEQSPMQIAMQKQYGDIVELLRTSAHGPLYMRPPNTFMSEAPGPAYPATAHPPHLTPLVTPPTSKKKKKSSTPSAAGAGSGAAGNFHTKFVGISSAFTATTSSSSSSSSHLQRESIPMTELQQQQHSSTASAQQPSSYAHHHSPPNYSAPPPTSAHSPPLPPNYPAPPPAAAHSPPLPPNYPAPPPTAAHSPPLPPNCQPHSTYPTTSGHTQYTTTNSSGYDHTPSSYEHQRVLVGETEMAPPASVAHTSASSTLHHSSVVDYHPLYPSADVSSRTRPLQHLTEAEMQTTFAPPESVGNHFMQSSPPQSGNSVSQHSPHSALQPSPNSYGASPSSLTPSPESQQNTIAAVGTVHGIVMDPVYNNYNMGSHFQHQFMSGTSV